MKRRISMLITLCFTLCFSLYAFGGDGSHVYEGWKAGVARVKITPESSMWMAGYGNRDHPSEGTLHDLWAKALVLEDNSGKQVVLVSTDLLGLPTELSNNVRDQLQAKFGFRREQIILNSSHTHTGPVLQGALTDLYPLDSVQTEKINAYSERLRHALVDLVGEAVRLKKPARIFAQNGITRFQVNRRSNNESQLNPQTLLNGPNDYAVPVMKVIGANGELMAITFGYACHATVLSSYRWSGDYPGFAQIELEKIYPGAAAMFFQGAGADINPLPRRSVALAQQYGKELAAAVERVLEEDMRELSPKISAAYSEAELSISRLPSKDELLRLNANKQPHVQRWATRLLKLIEEGKALKRSYLYPVQVWQLGEQTIISLGGEVVVDYALKLKMIFGQDIFVLGYSNDLMAYIPSAGVLRTGGYEGATSQFVYGVAGTWRADIETKIFAEILKVADQATVPYKEASLTDGMNNLPSLVKSEPGDVFSLTAEQASAEGEHIKYMPEWKAFGWFKAGEFVVWDADIDNDGLYDVYLEWSISDEEAGKQFSLSAGDQVLKGRIKRTGSWTNFKVENVGKIRLSKGRQQIKLLADYSDKIKGSLMDFRELKLIRVNK